MYIICWIDRSGKEHANVGKDFISALSYAEMLNSLKMPFIEIQDEFGNREIVFEN